MKSKIKINNTKLSIIGSIISSLSAILASSCCIIPIILFNLGVSGAWMSNLAVLQPYRTHFISVAVIMFSFGLVLFIRSRLKTYGKCNINDAKYTRQIPIIMIISVILITFAIIWPEIEPYLLKSIR